MPILFIILFLFITIPLIEIYFLIQIGSAIGALPTILAIVFTAVLGVFLIRIQGFSTMLKAQTAIQSGQVPALEMIEGVMLLIAAILLLIPGFATDTIGFVLLIPPVRKYLAAKAINGRLGAGLGHAGQWRSGHAGTGEYFEGEYEDLSPEQQYAAQQHSLKHKLLIDAPEKNNNKE